MGIDHIISSTLTPNTGLCAQSCASPCVDEYDTNLIFKFPRYHYSINSNDLAEYREEIGYLVSWCQINNLALNVRKTKSWLLTEGIEGMNRAGEEIVDNFMFPGIHIINNLAWSLHTDVNQYSYIFTH